MENNIRYTIQAAREQAGFTLEDMAYFLHVKEERYAKFETYEAVMTVRQGMYFMRLVKINPDYIQMCHPEETFRIRSKVGAVDPLHMVYGSNEKNQVAGNELDLVK